MMELNMKVNAQSALNLLFGAIAIWQTWRGNKLNRLVAERQGVFKESKLVLKLFGVSDIRTFVIIGPFKSRSFYIPFRFSLTNLGDTTAMSPEVFMRASEALVVDSPNVRFGLESDAVDIVVGRIVSEGAGTRSRLYDSIRELHPGKTVILDNLGVINEVTPVERTIEVDTSDGKKARAKITAQFSYSIEISLYEAKHEAKVETFRVFALDNSDITTRDALIALNGFMESRFHKRFEHVRYFRRFQIWKARSLAMGMLLVEISGKDIIGLQNGKLDTVSGWRSYGGCCDQEGFIVPGLKVVRRLLMR
jgi:hypothetical protein